VTSTLPSNETPVLNMKDQFNGKTKKRHPPPCFIGHEVYEMVKNVHVILGKQKSNCKNIEEDDMWKKQLIFWELPYWKDFNVRHSIDMMHVEKNVCESPFGHCLTWMGKLGTMDMHELI
jgi:hypothetical protein